MIIYFNPYRNYSPEIIDEETYQSFIIQSYPMTLNGSPLSFTLGQIIDIEEPAVFTGVYHTQLLRQAYLDAVNLGYGNYAHLTGINQTGIFVVPEWNESSILASGTPLIHSGNGIIGPGPEKYKITMAARPSGAGADPVDPAGYVTWGRGSFFNFTKLNEITLKGFHLCGGAPTTNSWGNPYNIPEGWDDTHKGLYGGTASSGFDNIFIEDVWISGMRGEMIYAGGGSANGLISVKNIKLWDCNASAISCTAKLKVEAAEIWDVYNGVENFAFEDHHQSFSNCIIERRERDEGGNAYALLGMKSASFAITGGRTKNMKGFLLADFAHNLRIKDVTVENGRFIITAGDQGSAYNSQRAGNEGFSGLHAENISLYASSGTYRAIAAQPDGDRTPFNWRFDKLSITNVFPGGGRFDFLFENGTSFSGNTSINNTVLPRYTRPWENYTNTTKRIRWNNCPIKDPLSFSSSSSNYTIIPLIEGVNDIDSLSTSGYTGYFENHLVYNDPYVMPDGFTYTLRNKTNKQTYFQPISGGTEYSIDPYGTLDLVYTRNPQSWGLPTYYISTGTDADAVTDGAWETSTLADDYLGRRIIRTDTDVQEDLKRALSYYDIPQKGWYEIKIHTATGKERNYGDDVATVIISGAGGRLVYPLDQAKIRGGWLNFGWHHLDSGNYGVVGIETTNTNSIVWDDSSVEYKTLHHVQEDAERVIINSGDGWDVYRNRLASGNNPKINTDRYYSRRVAYITNLRANNYFDGLIKDGSPSDPKNQYFGTGRADEFGGVYYNDSENAYAFPTNYSRSIRRFMHMAHCYLFQNNCNYGLTGLYQNEAVISGINTGLRWISVDRFSTDINWSKWSGDPAGTIPQTNTWVGDWFGLEIAFPQSFGELACLIGNKIDPIAFNNLENFLGVVRSDNTSWLQYNVSPPTLDITESANLLFVQKAWMYMGIYRRNTSYLQDVKDVIDVIFNPVTEGLFGWFSDGGYRKDGNLQIAGYLNNMIRDVPEIIYTLSGSAYAINTETVYPVLEEIFDKSFEPFVTHNGYTWAAIAGRGIGSVENDRVSIGMARSFAQLANTCLTGSFAEKAKKYVKTVIKQNDSWDAVVDEGTIQDWKGILHAADIADDPSIRIDPYWPNRARVVNSCATAMYRRPNWSALIRAGNRDIKAFENYDNDNRYPWYQGEVTTYLENGDGRWIGDTLPTIDPYRWPGVTLQIDEPRQYNESSQSATAYTFTDWAGGTALNDEAVVFGSDYNNANRDGDLVAKKSIFMIGDYQTHLGAGISAGSGYRIATIVDQIKLNSAGDNRLIVNGAEATTTIPWTGALIDTDTLFFEGNNNSYQGVYFYSPTQITGARTQRTGAWGVLDNEESNTIRTNKFLSLEIDHGVDPLNESYAYTVLPYTSSQEFGAFTGALPISITNTTDLQLVEYENYVAANVWAATSGAPANVGGWNVSHPCAIIIKDNGTGVDFSVSAPSTGNAWVRISNSAKSLSSIFGDLGVSGANIQNASQAAIDVELGNRRNVINFGVSTEVNNNLVLVGEDTFEFSGSSIGADLKPAGGLPTSLTLSYLSDPKTGTFNEGDNTFSSISFGTASSDRKVVVVLQGRHEGSADITAVTIGGQTATKAVGAIGTNATHKTKTEIWYADVPTGTSGDVVVTVTGSTSGVRALAAYTYSLVGASSVTVTDTDTGNNSTSFSKTLDCDDGGVILATVVSNPTAGSVVTWTGDVVEDYELDFGSNDVGSSASENELSAGTVDANVSVSSALGSYTCYAACTFAPV